jgi:hypothetical protein
MKTKRSKAKSETAPRRCAPVSGCAACVAREQHIAKLKAALLEARGLLCEWGPGPSDAFWIRDVCDPLLRK